MQGARVFPFFLSARIPLWAHICFLLIVGCMGVSGVPAVAQQTPSQEGNRNQPAQVDRFRDLGFGMFIHWGVDTATGPTISHSLAGASKEYAERYFTELPGYFAPDRFDPVAWARLAKLAGMRYVVFTTKHHSGFCMFRTASTDFNVINTPFGRDLTAEVVKAFRAEGIAVGFYFSPDDFHWLYRNGKQIDRNRDDVSPANNPGLMELDRAQVRELYTNYGPVDYFFIDGPPEGLRELAWDLQPGTVVTRGAIATPEQNIPGAAPEGAWESCITMGNSWQYRPVNESYKSALELIEMLVETRAKGGNLLLNVGPMPTGELPREQSDRLREIGLWMMANRDAIHGVRPWVITNENDIWFTRAKDSDTVYAIVEQKDEWKWGTEREITLLSVKASEKTEVSVLGQSGEVLEYRADVVPRTTFTQSGERLKIRATRAQRFYDNRRSPNPVVLKITHALPGFLPPQVVTARSVWDKQRGIAILEADLSRLADGQSVEARFQYRRKQRVDELYDNPEPWVDSSPVPLARNGRFQSTVMGLDPTREYEFRAVAVHPLITVTGQMRDLLP
ncbi:MAG: alpha-L-fucosidase [Bryobacterales bacterium]|nr:alpha-L-fucosidase [Bryobacterales bacterium]